MAKKKSYNPFKMWGSYVGAIIGFFFIPLPFPLGGAITGYYIIVNATSNLLMPIIWFWFLGGTLIGFFIGWTIHSIFRKLWGKFRR
ncbi:MAG: hypothetical protein AABY22_03815 [Nanoarchaeota archaeon]